MYIYISPPASPIPCSPQTLWKAPGLTAAVAHCGSGDSPPLGPRTAPVPTAAAVAHCSSGDRSPLASRTAPGPTATSIG